MAEKNIVNILPEDELYRIAARLTELQRLIKLYQQEADTLRKQGAVIMREHEWTHARSAEFVVCYVKTRAGFNWDKLKALPGYHACWNKSIPLAAPVVRVTPRGRNTRNK